MKKNRFSNLLKILSNDKSRITKTLSTGLMIVGVLALTVVSLYVANRSAMVHSMNHDQLIDSYMFEDGETFKEAQFPAAHTFFLKWPLFSLSSALGNTEAVYAGLTIAVYLLTVLVFLWMVYRLSSQNKTITGLASLLLASTLALVPIQPYNGTLLPVGMGMLTTRNIEFLFYFGFIYFALKATRINSLNFYIATAFLTILGITDKFFLMISLIASVLFMAFTFYRSRDATKLKGDFLPLVSAAISYVLANIVIVAINRLGITGIPGETNLAPFAIVGSIRQMFEALSGAVQGMLSNFGANIFGQSVGVGLLPYLVNLLIFCAAAVSVYLVFKIAQKSTQKQYQDIRLRYTFWLILSLVGSVIIFIASEHGYLYDARYLTLALFAGIAALAYLLGRANANRIRVPLIIASVLMIAVLPITALKSRDAANAALAGTQSAIGDRIDLAADIIKKHDVDLFVGDYWFSTPVKLATGNSVIGAPMSTDTCDTPNHFLTSNKWYKPSDTVKKSAHYILRDADADTFNHGCTMEYLDEQYGKPDAEYIIRSDDNNKPIDIIRIYSYDIREKFSEL